MIIKMTVNDNDFTQSLENFCENLFVKLCFRQDPKEITDETISKHYETQREVLRILNPNITSELTDEDKLVIRFVVFEVWCNHIDEQNMSEHTKKYLKDNFKCSVSFDFKDEWENGEAVYYFTTNQKWITQ